ncbi:hypothetical protein F442_22683, partial [Phytophthora nicotianae P10297]
AAPTTSQNVTICESTTEKPSMSDTPRASQIPTRRHTKITPEDLIYFRNLAATMPRAPDKWTKMLQLFREKYPDSDINANSLRCRLKVKKDRSRKRVRAEDDNPTSSLVPVAVALPKSTKVTACESCRKKRKRCGDATQNDKCERLQKTSSSNIQAFFRSQA